LAIGEALGWISQPILVAPRECFCLGGRGLRPQM